MTELLPILDDRYSAFRKRVGFLGDSKTAFAINNNASAKQWTNYGVVTHVRWKSKQRWFTDQSLVFGVPSTGVDHMLDTQVPAAISAGIQIAVIWIGINDIGVKTLGEMTAKYSEALELLHAAGIVALLVPIAPTNSNGSAGAGYANAAKQQQIAAFNRWLWIEAQKNAHTTEYCDIRPNLIVGTTGYALPAHLIDGLHDNVLSCDAIAGSIAASLDKIVIAAPPEPMVDSIFDVYDPVLNPAGNGLGSAGMLIGTGGFTANGATGQVPTGWQGRRGSTTTTLTVAFSKGTETENSTVPNVITTLGGVADGGASTLLSESITAFSAGDEVYAEGLVEWSGLTAIESVALRLGFNDASSTAFTAEDGSRASGKGNMPASGVAYFRTPSWVLPAGFTSLTVRNIITSAPSGDVAGTVKLSRVAVRKKTSGRV